MAGFRVEIVTIERLVYSDEVDIVLAPGVQGQLGILPKHTPLMSLLTTGELVVRKGGQEQSFAIGGGFLEVLPNRVVVLADSAERADEIDVQRAEAARERAVRLRQERRGRLEMVKAEADLRRSLLRLRMARRRAPKARMMGRDAPEQ